MPSEFLKIKKLFSSIRLTSTKPSSRPGELMIKWIGRTKTLNLKIDDSINKIWHLLFFLKKKWHPLPFSLRCDTYYSDIMCVWRGGRESIYSLITKLCVPTTDNVQIRSIKRSFCIYKFSNFKSFFNQQEPLEDQTKFKITQLIKLSTALLSNYANKKCDTNEDEYPNF